MIFFYIKQVLDLWWRYSMLGNYFCSGIPFCENLICDIVWTGGEEKSERTFTSDPRSNANRAEFYWLHRFFV